MRIALTALIFAGLVPLLVALRANRGTSLTHAILWTFAAWLGWGIAFLFGNIAVPGMDASRYCALCLTGCAGVAVLGARRPIVGAWNFVVLGLFAVMVLPLIETMFLRTHPVDGLRIFFIAATLTVGILNYMPTRFAPATVVLLAACAGEMLFLYAPTLFAGEGEAMFLHGLLMLTPWIGWMCLIKRGQTGSQFDRLWLSFRDRWGLLWSQRVREQFNNAAHNAGWPVHLLWRGLRVNKGVSPTDEGELLKTLQAVLQRFLASEGA